MRLGIVVFVTVALFVSAQSAAFAASSARSAAHASAVPPSADSGDQAGVLVSNSTGDPSSASDSGSLPFTGLDLRFVVVAGAFLLVAGAMLRKYARDKA
jgi:hypothetical protein